MLVEAVVVCGFGRVQYKYVIQLCSGVARGALRWLCNKSHLQGRNTKGSLRLTQPAPLWPRSPQGELRTIP